MSEQAGTVVREAGIIDATPGNNYRSTVMTAIAQQLERKLKEWPPTTSKKVKRLVTEIIALADRKSPEKNRAPKLKKPRKEDSFFADKEFYSGPAPKDSSVNHDKYLYGDAA